MLLDSRVYLITTGAVIAVLGTTVTLTYRSIRLARERDGPMSDEYGITNAIRMVATVFALLSSFMIANLWSSQSDLDARLTEEVASLAALVEEVALSAPHKEAAATKLQYDYMMLVRDHEVLEHTRLRGGGLRFTPSPDAQTALAGLREITGELTPRVDRAYTAFLQARVTRLSWQPIIGKVSLIPVTILTASITFLLGIQKPDDPYNTRTTWIAALAPATAICVLVVMMIMLLEPGAGDLRRAAALTAYLETMPV